MSQSGLYLPSHWCYVVLTIFSAPWPLLPIFETTSTHLGEGFEKENFMNLGRPFGLVFTACHGFVYHLGPLY